MINNPFGEWQKICRSMRSLLPSLIHWEVEVEKEKRPLSSKRGEAGVGLMEVIVGALLTLIIGSILLHFVRLGFALYQLNSTTNYIAQELEKAKEMASFRMQDMGVIFEAKGRKYGIDRNGNGRLESAESEELPDGVNISSDAMVIFTRSGRLVGGSREPQILISNSRNTRMVSVSSLGSVVID
jgi:hypothetical protein